MQIYRLESYSAYQQHFLKQHGTLLKRHALLNELQQKHAQKEFSYTGFSITANEFVNFQVDWKFSDGENINWRERLICPVTGLNNRQRASYHLMLNELSLYAEEDVYITEQVTPFYNFLSSKEFNVIGSEYLSDEYESGFVDDRGINHQDLTKLSFEDESLSAILSFDCFEHIPKFEDAIQECYRSLRTGGSLMATFPFSKRSEKNLIRARLESDGTVTHFEEPEYHGNPLTQEGCLSYYTFGWEVLEQLRAAGFSSVYAVLYWSDIFAYLGDEQICIIARK